MKIYNNLPQNIYDLGQLPDGEYIGSITGMKARSQYNTSMICSFDIEIVLEDNGFDSSGKVKKSKAFYEKGESFLTSFLHSFGAVSKDGEIDWKYFNEYEIPVFVTLETNEEGKQYVTDVMPQYEEYEDDDYEYEED